MYSFFWLFLFVFINFCNKIFCKFHELLNLTQDFLNMEFALKYGKWEKYWDMNISLKPRIWLQYKLTVYTCLFKAKDTLWLPCTYNLLQIFGFENLCIAINLWSKLIIALRQSQSFGFSIKTWYKFKLNPKMIFFFTSVYFYFLTKWVEFIFCQFLLTNVWLNIHGCKCRLLCFIPFLKLFIPY